jgi:hypothetical protein
LSILNKQYGLSKGTDEAMFVIEAYKTLRDRSPYPADQVVKELDGSVAFVVYDSKNGGVFAALVYMLIYHVFLFCESSFTAVEFSAFTQVRDINDHRCPVS